MFYVEIRYDTKHIEFCYDTKQEETEKVKSVHLKNEKDRKKGRKEGSKEGRKEETFYSQRESEGSPYEDTL